MGLDMYLTKKHYIGAEYEHRNVKSDCQITINGEPVKINWSKVSEISERCGYWRKANHIHRWFVENCQDGEDNCEEYYVSREKLKELLELCKTAILNKEKAGDILKTKGGFFFGSTEVNEWYFEKCQDTINFIEDILKDEITSNGGTYLPYEVYYRASW